MSAAAKESLAGCLLGGATACLVQAPSTKCSAEQQAVETVAEGQGGVSRRSQTRRVTTDIALHVAQGIIDATKRGSPTNLEVRNSVHARLRTWAKGSQNSLPSMAAAALARSSEVSCHTDNLAPTNEALLIIAPIGFAFATDPGRAFFVAIDVSALISSHPPSCVAAGAFAMTLSLISSGMSLDEAMLEVFHFLHPIEWAERVAEVFWENTRPRENDPPETRFKDASAENTISAALTAVRISNSFEEAISTVGQGGAHPSIISLAGQLAGAVFGADQVPESRVSDPELRGEIERISNELLKGFGDPEGSQAVPALIEMGRPIHRDHR